MICKLFEATLPRSSGRGGKDRYVPCHPYTAPLGIHQVHQGGVWPIKEGMGTTLILAQPSPIRVGYHWLKVNLNHLPLHFLHVRETRKATYRARTEIEAIARYHLVFSSLIWYQRTRSVPTPVLLCTAPLHYACRYFLYPLWLHTCQVTGYTTSSSCNKPTQMIFVLSHHLGGCRLAVDVHYQLLLFP